MSNTPHHLHCKEDSDLQMELFREVTRKLESLPRSRLDVIRLKVLILPLAYLAFYFYALQPGKELWIFFLSYAGMGFLAVLIFVNLIHEACHGNIFKNEKYNRLTYYLFDILGANGYIWKQRHLFLHHRFPNTNGWDADVEQKGPLAIFPHEPVRKYQRYQHLYIFLLYPLFMLNWLFIRDFRDYFSPGRVIRKVVRIPRREYVRMILFKLFFLVMILGGPVWAAGYTFREALAGLFIMSATGSLLAMVVLLTPHINEESIFAVPGLKGEIPYSWFRHQLLATNDIESSNWFSRHLMGNFNYHLVHHLFPRISSAYAPELTKVLREFLKSHNLPYRSYSITQSLKKHYSLILNNALRSGNLKS